MNTSYQNHPAHTSQKSARTTPHARPLDAAAHTPKLVRDTPGGPAKIAAAQTMLMIWALERGLPWSTPCLD